MNITFTPEALEHYQYLAEFDRKLFKKAGQLITDIRRNPFDGLGQPETLKHELSGFWSRRISGEHRLVYKIENNTVIILQCRYHY